MIPEPMPAAPPAPPRAIRWIFFDVGNILLDEDPLTFFTFSRHVQAVRRVCSERTFSQLSDERDALAAAGSRWPVFDVMSRYLDQTALAELWSDLDREVRTRYSELCPPIPGAIEAVDRLRNTFRLGLIANQPVECPAWLETLGWLERFEVVILSEAEWVAKPDQAIFRRALDRSGAEPAECLMVGDRLDNDVAPSAGLGLSTCLVRWPVRQLKGWPTDAMAADTEAWTYLQAQQGLAAWREAHWTGPRPSFVCDTIGDLGKALEKFLMGRNVT